MAKININFNEKENIKLKFKDNSTNVPIDMGGKSIIVDDKLSTTSKNPVQNKVITNALEDKADKADVLVIEQQLETKADASDLQRVESELETKADASELQQVESILEDKANIVDLANVAFTGNYGDLTRKPIHQKTKSEWDSEPNTIAELNNIYVYLDYFNVDGVSTPAIKIGDGTSYLIDLPTVNGLSVSEAEKIFWNNKVTCFLATVDNENIVFSKN